MVFLMGWWPRDVPPSRTYKYQPNVVCAWFTFIFQHGNESHNSTYTTHNRLIYMSIPIEPQDLIIFNSTIIEFCSYIDAFLHSTRAQHCMV